MRPVNIYALTRIEDPFRIAGLERQMSGRRSLMKVKQWETEGLKKFSDCLSERMKSAPELKFYYSFVMPKLGKEFDLLRIDRESVVNVELKSGNVSDDAIKKQLIQNRYYLSLLGKTMYFFTFISKANRLVRLSHAGRLVEARWEELVQVFEKQTDCYCGEIEDLFKEEKYLISPLSHPNRFLRQEYFLTAQQTDIKNKILRQIRKEGGRQSVQGFTGLPGTGKTILLYDIAMLLSWKSSVCVFHLGSKEEGLKRLDQRLKRIDFYDREALEKDRIYKKYSAVFVDEGHRIDQERMEQILRYAGEWDAPVIFSYDREDAIADEERRQSGAERIEQIPGLISYRLTNRIRMNRELSSFIRSVMCTRSKNHRQVYPSVSIAYAGDEKDAQRLLLNYQKDGYQYIWDAHLRFYTGAGNDLHCDRTLEENGIEVMEATCKEYEKVVMMLDASFFYDENGYMRSVGEDTGENDYRVRNLFHGLSRAKNKIALVVYDNIEVFDELLYLLQRVSPAAK